MDQIILDSYPYHMERHLHGSFDGLEALTHLQGACGFYKWIRYPKDLATYRTCSHKESPPFLTPSRTVVPFQAEGVEGGRFGWGDVKYV
ncbi:MAG: hypothetical protein JSW15_01170, partial [Deltaproteobacteria bacterium]